ncbi:cytochrome P450 [Paracoccus lichenicola]|nr:cytochrome P450 [Paracoccus lichenicola]
MSADIETLEPKRDARTVDPAGIFFDPLSYSAFDHPYEMYRLLRDHAPVYYNERRDLWVLSRYEDVQAALRDHARMVNALGNDMDGTHDSYGPGNLIALDPPYHGVLRDLVQPSFTPKAVKDMEARMRALARDLLARFRAAGGGDFVTDVALPLVFDSSMRLLGAPVGDTKFWQDHLLRSMARTIGQFGIPEDAAASNREAEEHLAEVVRGRRAEVAAGINTDAPDVITQILTAARKGVTLDEAEEVGLAHLVLSASTDAPEALLTNCLAVLDKFPGLQRHLKDNPGAIRNFVEETLRYDGPAKNLCRQTTADVTIRGVTIPRDSRVMVLMGSASRDERVYDDPDLFDVARRFTSKNKILTFGEGIHNCMGAPIARLLAQVLLEELVAGLDGDEYRIVGTPERWAKQMVRGFASLPMKIVPAGRDTRKLKPHASAAHVQSLSVGSTRLTVETKEFEAPVRVTAKTVEADGVVSLLLAEAGGELLPEWTPGAHVDLILGDGVPTRQYSLCGDPQDRRQFRLGILREPAGSGGSVHVHDRLAEGDVIRIRGPRNNFELVPAPRYVFIAGGIGITPILPMIRAAEAAGADWTLHYGGRSRASMAFTGELERHGGKVRIWPQDETGLLDLAHILGQPDADTKVYCCGPEPLLGAVEKACAAWPRKALHLERFAARPLGAPVRNEPFEVHLARSQRTLIVPPEQSILSVIEEAGIGVMSSCGEGTCGTCEVKVLEGEPDHRDSVLDAEARESGDTMMICVSRACGKRLVLDI